jgi:cell shape-determining protein MreC
MEMNMSIIFTLIALIVLALVMALMSLGQRLSRAEKKVQDLTTDLLTINGAISALCEEEIDAGRRREDIEHRLQGIRTRQDELELREKGDSSYTQAIKLIHRGASIDDIMSACGLNRGEAELIFSLHGNKRFS